MEIELVRTILAMPYNVYKSSNYVSNSLDTSHDIWFIKYRRSKKSEYVIRVHDWEGIHIALCKDGYPLRIDYAPKYLVKIVNKLANYLSILGFPVKIRTYL